MSADARLASMLFSTPKLQSIEEDRMRMLLSMVLAIGSLSLVAIAQTRDSLTVLHRSDTHQPNQEVIAAVDTLAPGARAN